MITPDNPPRGVSLTGHHYRMRANPHLARQRSPYHIIFNQRTKCRLRVDSFPAASELINPLMTAMMDGILTIRCWDAAYSNRLPHHPERSGDCLAALPQSAERRVARTSRSPARCAAGENLNVHLIGRTTKTKIVLNQDYIDSACRWQVKR
ncbi:hypothetical protein ACNKHO_25470 [Shigella flexneri]